MIKSENHCGGFVDSYDSGLSVPSSQRPETSRNTPTFKQVGLIAPCCEGADTVENH